jgi:hypothetical protein
MKWLWILCILALSIAFVLPAQAQELTTSRAIALNSAMSAAASGTSAIWHNPAGIGAALMYAAEAAYQYDNSKGGHGFGANVMDMKSNGYLGSAIGFAYEYSKADGKTRHASQTRFGLALRLQDGLVSVGLSGLYTNVKWGGKREISHFSMDTGLIIRPIPWFSLGFSAQNLITGDHADTHPRKISTGLAFTGLEIGLNIMGEVAFNVSAKSPKKTAEYAIGAEYFLVRAFPLRLAYRYESANSASVVSAGTGYRDKSGYFGFDISYLHHFKPKNHIVSTSLSVYF